MPIVISQSRFIDIHDIIAHGEWSATSAPDEPIQISVNIADHIQR